MQKVMGLPYDYAIDVWSAACTLYELFTGKILFPGRSNNQMLKHIMEVMGKFPNRMIRKGQFSQQHFDEDNSFISVEIDRLSNKVCKLFATRCALHTLTRIFRNLSKR